MIGTRIDPPTPPPVELLLWLIKAVGPAVTGSSGAPFFRAFDALAVDDAGGRAGLAPDHLSALHVQDVVNAFQRAVVVPQIEIIEERALGWKVFGNIAPLTARAQYIHDPVDDLAHIDFPLSPATLCRGNQRRDVRPLLVRQIARITQLVTIVLGRFSHVHIGGPSRTRPPTLNHI